MSNEDLYKDWLIKSKQEQLKFVSIDTISFIVISIILNYLITKLHMSVILSGLLCIVILMFCFGIGSIHQELWHIYHSNYYKRVPFKETIRKNLEIASVSFETAHIKITCKQPLGSSIIITVPKEILKVTASDTDICYLTYEQIVDNYTTKTKWVSATMHLTPVYQHKLLELAKKD